MRGTLLLLLYGIISYSYPRQGAFSEMHQALSFEPNLGQSDSSVRYLASRQGSAIWLTAQGAVLGITNKSGTAYLKLRFAGANRSAVIEAEQRVGGVSNYFLGKDPAKWRTDVPHYARVRYRDIYPGIDVVFYGNPDQLEYDFVVRPGADPSRIRLAFDGARSITTDDAGGLIFKIANGEVRTHAPVIRQNGKPVAVHYILRGSRIGFALASYDHSTELVIDPIVTYATFLGGNIGDQAYSVAMDKQGNIFIAGETSSPNFPAKNALYPTVTSEFNNAEHAFLAKFNPSASDGASLIFSTLFGSDGTDLGNAVTVDASGNPVLAGYTGSPDNSLPQMNPFATPPMKSTTCGPQGFTTYCGSAFVAKFTSSGNALMYSSYLTGSNDDQAYALATDSSGNTWVTGYTTSVNFPMRGQPLQNTVHASYAGFVSEISPAGSLLYSTFFGGEAGSTTALYGIAIDSKQNAYVAGYTTASTMVTTPGAYQPHYPPKGAAIIAEISPTSGLAYCTYLGGIDNGNGANAIALDSAGNIYVAGTTYATQFPVTSGAVKSTFNDVQGLTGDGFLTKLNPSAAGNAQLVYSTYFGGTFVDSISGIAVDPAGRILVAGSTNSLDLPTTPDAFECCFNGYVTANYISEYGFVARIDPGKSGSAGLLYSTYLGGTSYTTLNSLALDSSGNILAVAGIVESADTPVTPSAFQSTFGGQSANSQYNTDYGDAYLSRFDFSQTGPLAKTFLNGAGLDAISNPQIAPGLIFTVKGTGLGPSVFSLAQLDPNTGLISTNVSGVQVMVNNIPCALTYVSSTQINAIAPYELAKLSPGTTVNIQTYYNGVPGVLLRPSVAATAPGILSLADGSGQGVILNQDGSLNGPNNPAALGSIITIYATGEGQTSPPGIDGGIANNLNALPHPVAALSVSIGGVTTAAPAYAGTAPEEIYGLLQVNVTVPNGVTPGSAVPVVLTIGGNSSQTGLTMAVKSQ